MSGPSERELARIERELRQKKPGTQRAVGEGIYMRLDRSGRRRFQFRVRTATGSQPSGTYDSFEQALVARGRKHEERPPTNGEPTAADIRSWTVERYAQEAWWPSVLLDCDALTQIDYRRGLDDLLPLVVGVTLNDFITSPLLVDRLRQAAKELKTYEPGHKRAGELAPAAADKIIKTARTICGHAVKRRVLPYNPLAGVELFNRKRSAAGDAAAPSHRPIAPSEVKHPNTLALVGVGMRGDLLTLLRRRTIPELIATGMRPSDIMAMRNRWWRDDDGPLRYLRIDAAVKDLAGHLLEGEPKTGARDIYLFDAVAERLEAIYQLAGRPDLDELTFPNRDGGLLDWGNWRTGVWYPALHRAGIISAPSADARGAFVPYALRHVGVTIMLHATRHDTGTGTYSEREVARQFGHTVATLDRVYADIPKDMHGIAGLTMDEILRQARRRIWGAMPGDPDYEPVEHDLVEAANLTRIDNKALAARIQRGSLPGTKRAGRYYVTEFDLAWSGLLPTPEISSARALDSSPVLPIESPVRAGFC